MARIPPSSPDESISKLEQAIENLVIKGELKLICGVGRKVNTGNYENIDVFCAVGIPMHIAEELPLEALDSPQLQAVVEHAAQIGFAMTSKETGDRYTTIKEMQAGGRK